MNPDRASRLRIRVDDDPDLTWDLGPDDLAAASGPAARAPTDAVTELAVTSSDRAAGVRRFEVTLEGWTLIATVESEARARLRERATQDDGARRQHGPVNVSAPMTGRVVRLWVAEGDTVEAGQRMLAVEAMKMENEIRSPRAGVVASIVVAVGDSVEHGDELITVR